MFSCEFYQIFQNTYFAKHLQTTASEMCSTEEQEAYSEPCQTSNIERFA